MADVAKEEKIVHITEMLSNYMRYVMSDTFEPRSLKEEIAFIRNYVEIQQIRYGKEAFSFEVIMEDTIDTYLVPTLIIHNFVENAITHAVSLDNHVEITLYIVNENYEDGEYLYLSLIHIFFPILILRKRRILFCIILLFRMLPQNSWKTGIRS